MTHFDWDVSQDQKDFFAFYSALINFRKECPLLGRDEFLKPDDITWHEDNWSNTASKFLAFTLHGKCGSTSACCSPYSSFLSSTCVSELAMHCRVKACGIE